MMLLTSLDAERRALASARTRPSLSLLPLCVVLAGCGAGAEHSSGSAMRDSAGVLIVENTSYRWPEGRGWRLSDEPTVRIGVQQGEPEYEFRMIHRALRLKEGRIAVAAAGVPEIRYYDADGMFLHASGRRGEGPGEFRVMTSIWTLDGDSILVYDQRLRRVSVFGPDGSFTRSFTFPAFAGAPALPQLVGPTPDRWLIARERPIAAGDIQTGVRVDSTHLLRFDLEGSLIDTIGFVLEREYFLWNEGGEFLSATRAFGRAGHWALYETGFYYGDGDSYEIRYYAADGTLRRSIRGTSENPEVRSADIEAYKETMVGRAREPQRRALMERFVAAMPFPETMPALGSLIVDNAGNLWVSAYPRPGEGGLSWTVFDPDGVMLGIVETPPRFTVYEIGSDYVLGRWIDELDVQHIQLYGLIKN